MEYKCLRCNHNFKLNKIHLATHLKKQKVCETSWFDFSNEYLLELLENNEYINLYNSLKNKKQCKHCGKHLFKYNLNRHYKTCKGLKNNEKDLNIIVESNSNLKLEPQSDSKAQIINNIKNVENMQQINNNIVIVNPVGNESFDIKNIHKLLNFDTNSNHFHQENDIHNFSKRLDNYIQNYNIIFDKIYENPENHNFKIMNKKKGVCKIKEESNIKFIDFQKLSDTIFKIIDNVYNLAIIEYELNNDNIKLNHYKEFKTKIKQRYQKFINKYKNTTSNKDKKMYYDILYKFYKGFKDLLKNNEDKIFLKSYTIDRHCF